jgi:hypothetical protein
LTVIRFNLPAQAAQQPYLRAQWKNHEHPYAGDVINAYNDGAPAPDQAPLGPFYELESSSPAPALAPGAVLTHTQETIHGEGTEAALNELSLSLLHLSLNEINAAF